MEDVDMSQPMPANHKGQAMHHLDQARAFLRASPADYVEGLFHATKALRLANNDTKIQALANILSATCHENNEHYHLAYYAYLAAKGQDPRRWTDELENSLRFCECKVYPR
ncbi:hypothetical protein NLG97_g4121 [Lecanicillium saksenae]|uniref:Uncharacterized protein n=1 Tax=Lecanicillium saksenae TaxID=468837 RepID=A0ACC1QYR4_9HYPO|nr:hypothetical protein NLG97_g4121 [Lecanicillium saksenae]